MPRSGLYLSEFSENVILDHVSAYPCPRCLLQRLHRRVCRNRVQLLQPGQGMLCALRFSPEITELPPGQARDRVDISVDWTELNLSLPCMNGPPSAALPLT